MFQVPAPTIPLSRAHFISMTIGPANIAKRVKSQAFVTCSGSTPDFGRLRQALLSLAPCLTSAKL